MSVKVSVIIPIYNSERFLPAVSACVLGQSHQDLELILVDDGSKDQSLACCEQLARTDVRVKVLTKMNGGPASARNLGLKAAAGEVVYFLDADDRIEPQTLEIMVADFLGRNKPDMVLSNFRKINTTGEIQDIPNTFQEDPRDYVRHFLAHPSNHLISYCWARLYKLSLIREHGIQADETMQLFEDYCFNLAYLSHARSIVFIDKPLYTYLMDATGTSASMKPLQSGALLRDMRLFKQITLDFMPVNPREVGHALMHYAIIFMIRSCWSDAPGLRGEFNAFIRDPLLSECLSHYRPHRGNSRILPLLVRLKWTGLLIRYCRYRSRKRYGRPKRGPHG
jgi:glycosyltransferase involved in cell wall biosynthesis